MSLTRSARRGRLAALVLGAIVAPRGAAADALCSGPGRSVVELVLDVDPPDRIIGTTLEQHLRAELAARDIDVCLSPVAASPGTIAKVKLHVQHPSSGAFLATIQVGDLILDKRVERTIDLAKIPADGRPLAVAASTDELLRASWVELTIPDAPAPVFTPPPEVVRALHVVEPSPKRPPPSLVELGLVATGSDFFGHRVGVGVEPWLALWFHPRVAVALRFTAEVGLPRASADGSAHIDTVGPGAALIVALPHHDARFGVRFEAAVDALDAHLVGTTTTAAIATDGTQWTPVAGVTLRGWARTGPVAWTLGVGAIGALRGVAATDDGANVTSIMGLGGRVDAGLVYAFH